MRLLTAFPRISKPLHFQTQPITGPSIIARALSTASIHPLTTSSLQTLHSEQRGSPLPSQASFTTTCLRHDSTTPLSNTPSHSDPTLSTTPLTWNEFFRLRKIRRYYSTAASATTGFGSLVVGTSLLAQQNLQTLGQQLFGLDPMVVMGIWTLSFAGAGWLLGPVVGGGLFRVFNRKEVPQMAEKEKNFFERVRKYRVDPTSSSMQNPVPDFYGEKITSVKAYRSWLKDQRAFNKKRQRFV